MSRQTLCAMGPKWPFPPHPLAPASVKLLSKGLSNMAIAKTINRSEETVKFHLKNVYMKLGVSSRVQLVLMMVGTEEAVSGPGRVKA